MTSEKQREVHRNRYLYENQVGSSFDPDIEDMDAWEYEDDLPGKRFFNPFEHLMLIIGLQMTKNLLKILTTTRWPNTKRTWKIKGTMSPAPSHLQTNLLICQR